ncbi:hypothetical protein K439DRAFT_569450 [Ramaria rubella]|nr:hypothetical protein K439DRAFT_569450 [Ramaria rubella]
MRQSASHSEWSFKKRSISRATTGALCFTWAALWRGKLFIDIVATYMVHLYSGTPLASGSATRNVERGLLRVLYIEHVAP